MFTTGTFYVCFVHEHTYTESFLSINNGQKIMRVSWKSSYLMILFSFIGRYQWQESVIFTIGDSFEISTNKKRRFLRSRLNFTSSNYTSLPKKKDKIPTRKTVIYFICNNLKIETFHISSFIFKDIKMVRLYYENLKAKEDSLSHTRS